MRKEKTLLQKAKESKSGRATKRSFTKEDTELVMAWVNDEITLTQLGKAVGKQSKGVASYSYVALVLKNHLRK